MGRRVDGYRTCSVDSGLERRPQESRQRCWKRTVPKRCWGLVSALPLANSFSFCLCQSLCSNWQFLLQRRKVQGCYPFLQQVSGRAPNARCAQEMPTGEERIRDVLLSLYFSYCSYYLIMNLKFFKIVFLVILCDAALSLNDDM